MARAFVAASTQYLESDTGILTGTPISMAAWYKTDSNSADQVLIQLTDKDVGNMRFRLELRGSVGGDPVRANTEDASGVVLAVTSSGFSTGVWEHACAVFAAANDRRVYINGGSKGTNATSRTPTGIDRISIGRDGDNAPSNYMSGDIAEAALWNVSLTDDDVASLAKGMSPLLVRPEGLVAYWPIIGRTSPEIDTVGGVGLTVTSATASNHCRIFNPGRGR